ncbi:LPXTG cell wall anchor domain-containing protein [Enterococcus sp. DIV0242_7C1]|uniref:Gram-positive cocci surface proteins LPxTG domain-containing protein n=1 Tax=Candidatus Enterococcus dunnyi TaxID=1834192 RepID=A0A200IZI8_9ENTE|nr:MULTISPECIES: LPXTG cell wall anchor domain-containing protein [unclassified Enterococcus]MBO0469961.1 LPXTG cell wall anchor domain-containing protein [Enterococcus sp. DIV0242_7C1]OUZ30402.1 hypothetical protein A5889_002690 [Enterococcus sp. 9D6_DIV0238]
MRKNVLFAIFSVLFVGVLFSTSTAFAESGVGGQVITEGKITFYETETSLSESQPPQQSSSEPVTSEKAVAKPVGKLPSTGELVKNYGLIGGGLLLLILLVFLYKKRQKKEAQ